MKGTFVLQLSSSSSLWLHPALVEQGDDFVFKLQADGLFTNPTVI